MLEFDLRDYDFIPLNDLLKTLQLVGTGGEANLRITYGDVLVNGAVETRKRKKIRAGDVVAFQGTQITVS
ncbi:MAG: RNA-binding S4 domain-containing protein [Lewinellaceae bacterium]|nr:RNA-binding S4 domain-containing protein [Lewinellaceae bacterium]